MAAPVAMAAGCALPAYETDPAANCASLALNNVCDRFVCPNDPQCVPIAGGTGGLPPTGGTGGLPTGGTGGQLPTGGVGGQPPVGGTGGVGTGATGGAPPPGPGPLTIDDTCWVPRESNVWGIQGGWYAYADGVTAVIPEPWCPYDPEPQGMCLAGNTIEDPTFAAWGAGLALDLNHPVIGATAADKLPWDATAYGITGVRITVTGSFPQGIRVNFTHEPEPVDPQPFVEISTGPGTYDIDFTDAFVPPSWPSPTAGMRVDPTLLNSIQVQLIGANEAGPFQVCITEIELF